MVADIRKQIIGCKRNCYEVIQDIAIVAGHKFVGIGEFNLKIVADHVPSAKSKHIAVEIMEARVFTG